jgi:diguanylate cyclase (GGDEF)-like protein
MKNGKLPRRARKALANPARQPVRDEKSPRQAAAVSAGAAFIVSAALWFRSFTGGSPASLSTLSLLRILLCALPLAWGLAVLGLSFRRKGTPRFLISPEGLFPGMALAVWATAFTVMDAAVAAAPVVLLGCSVLSGLLYWNRAGLLALFVLPPLLPVAAAYVLLGGARLDRLVEAGLAAFFAFLAAQLVKQDTMPSEERLRSLEVENKELWNLSFRDGLTGLYNRRFAQETGRTLFVRASRYHEEFHALMLDIDHFKQVNDKLGHQVGDEVLKDVAEVIRANVRGSDIAARYGGEEFIVYVVRAEPELVQFVANRIRDGIASHDFPGVPWQVTISIGVAGMQPTDTLEELVERADRNLYISKHGGRNRVSGF